MARYVKPQPPSPCEVYRPDDDGSLVCTEVLKPKARKKVKNEYEPDTIYNEYRLVAIDENDREVPAGYAEDMKKAHKKASEWFVDHPEHKEVLIYKI